jgi:hypothetical protein
MPPVTKSTSYWSATRAPRYSLLFALPLFALYQLLSVVRPPHAGADQIRNGADVILQSAFTLVAGRYGPVALLAVMVVASLVLIARDVRANGRGFRAGIFVGMSAEAVAYALVFGLVVGTLTAHLLGTLHAMAIGAPGGAQSLDRASRLVISLGAGLYEELLFRVILVSALAWLARVVLGAGRVTAGVLATIVGALIFSASHYVGAYGDRLELQSFVYRAIGGVVFSALYLTRGFGITAWTHALYDLFLLAL